MRNFKRKNFTSIFSTAPKVSGYYPCCKSLRTIEDVHDHPENIYKYLSLFEYFDAGTMQWSSRMWGTHAHAEKYGTNAYFWFGLKQLYEVKERITK